MKYMPDARTPARAGVGIQVLPYYTIFHITIIAWSSCTTL
jgi:hypothetical protein